MSGISLLGFPLRNFSALPADSLSGFSSPNIFGNVYFKGLHPESRRGGMFVFSTPLPPATGAQKRGGYPLAGRGYGLTEERWRSEQKVFVVILGELRLVSRSRWLLRRPIRARIRLHLLCVRLQREVAGGWCSQLRVLLRATRRISPRPEHPHHKMRRDSSDQQ